KPLRSLVSSYHGYRRHGGGELTHRGLPSAYLTVIITFGDPLVLAVRPDPRQQADGYRTLLGRVHTRPALITRTEREAGIQLALRNRPVAEGSGASRAIRPGSTTTPVSVRDR